MKIVALLARILLGLIFVIFGLNGFLNFMKGPMPTGNAGAFLNAMIATHYLYLVAGVQILAGILFLLNRFLGLALVLSGALLANILTFHLTMAPMGLGMAAGVTVLWLILAVRHRSRLAPLFVAAP